MISMFKIGYVNGCSAVFQCCTTFSNSEVVFYSSGQIAERIILFFI